MVSTDQYNTFLAAFNIDYNQNKNMNLCFLKKKYFQKIMLWYKVEASNFIPR